MSLLSSGVKQSIKKTSENRNTEKGSKDNSNMELENYVV